MSYLERMRAKPRHVKGQHAFFGALFVTLIVAGFWTLSLPAKFASITDTAEQSAPTAQSETSDLADLINSARDQLGSTIETVDEAGSPGEAISQETAGLPQATSRQDVQMEEVKKNTEESSEEKREGRVILIATTSSKGTE